MGCRSDEAAAPQQVSLTIDAPDASWSLHIVEAHDVYGELWVLSRLQQRPGPAAQVVTPVSDTRTVEGEVGKVRHFVVGKTWDWENRNDVTFVDSAAAFHRRLPSEAAQLLPAPREPGEETGVVDASDAGY